jgi:hypothetical protein
VLTHSDLADQKISLDDIVARPTQCCAPWLRNHLPYAHTPECPAEKFVSHFISTPSGAKGTCKNKFAILGVEVPAR